MDIKDILSKQASLYKEKIAIIFEEETVTFEQLKNMSFSLANYLVNSGIRSTDKIASFLPNTPETIVVNLATFSIGACLVPLDFMLTEEEIINFVNHSEAKVLFIHSKKGVNLERIREKCLSLKEIILCGEEDNKYLSLREVLEKNVFEPPSSSFSEDNLSSILYTSGSVGHPKGVMLTYKHFDNPIKCMNYFLDISSKDVLLCGGVPFSHIGGLDYILVMLNCGATLVLMGRFKPYEFLKNIEQHRVTFFWIVPSMYVAILSLKEYDKFDLSSLRYAVVFGAPSSPVLLKRFHKICPNAYLLNGWGMTETAAPNCVLPPGVDRVESIGKFAPGMEAKIVDEAGVALGEGKEGELWVKGEAVMVGYYKAPELTQEVLTEDWWLKTGDIAKFDKDGLFYIGGRKKDMIKVGGEVVFSSEVEEKIYRYPKVKEVAVIGVPDSLRGEVPKAFIVSKEGEDLESEELREFLNQHLAHFKIPHYFEFVKDLPRNRTGKIDKQKLLRIESSK